MKFFYSTCFLVLINLLAFSQTIIVNGKISDGQGKPIPFAFIHDIQHSYATYSNNEGVFSLIADPASKIATTAAGYKDVTVSVDNKTDINIVLTTAATADNSKKANSFGFFQTNTSTPLSTTGSSYLKSGAQEVHGSRYLYEKWVHGFAVSPADSLIQSNDYQFNYDKISGELLFTHDQQNVYLADKGQVKIFTLFDDSGQSVTYEHVPAINPKQYVQVIALGPKYKIYKQGITKFEPNNYNTNGITTSGHNYDEYVDESNFFVIKAGGQPQKISLKKKSLKEIFAADADKLNKFISAEQGDIDEVYLKDLGEALNK